MAREAAGAEAEEDTRRRLRLEWGEKRLPWGQVVGGQKIPYVPRSYLSVWGGGLPFQTLNNASPCLQERIKRGALAKSERRSASFPFLPQSLFLAAGGTFQVGSSGRCQV